MLASEKVGDDVDPVHIASRTDGFSGSDLKAVCTAAAMCPLREMLQASGKSAKASLPSLLVLRFLQQPRQALHSAARR